MDFTQTNVLSMIGNDDFVTTEELDNYVTLGTAQTITGDKTLSGTTTITGNVVANGLTISPTEIGYLDGVSSNIQTQLNDRALDSTVVHRTGGLPETVSGIKSFTSQIVGTANIDISGAGNNLITTPSGTNILRVGAIDRVTTTNQDTKIFGRTYAGWRANENSIEINTFTSPTINTNMWFHSGGTKTGGGANDYDARITSVGGTTDINGRGALTIEDGTFTVNSATSNALQVGGTPKITTTSSLTTLSNTAHTINGVTTFDVPPVSATAPTTNSQVANKKYVDDTVVAGAFVTLANPQTITGDKTFSGTTTFTGNITANALTITPTELGYLDGASSNLQTQITARALDSNVVHKSGTETIDGDKTFTGTTVVAKTNANTNIQFANVPNYTFIDMCSGGNADYDVRLSSAYGGTTTAARGIFGLEAGSNYLIAYSSGSAGFNKIETTGGSGSYNQLVSHQNYIDATADNILRIGGTNRLSMNANTTTLTNQYNTLNATTVNYLSATTTGSQNYLFTSGTNSNNLLEATGTGSYNYLNAPSNIINSSSAGTTSVRSSGIDKLVIRNDATTAADQMIAPIYKIGTYASSGPLLSFQLHGVKRGANTTAGILLGPCYNFTSTDEMFNYCLPCNIEFTRATLMFDADGTSSGTMNLDFSRKSTNGGTPALVHSMGVAYTTGGATSFSQAFPINTGSPLKYNAGEFITVAYSGSPANEWGIVFHGFQY